MAHDLAQPCTFFVSKGDLEVDADAVVKPYPAATRRRLFTEALGELGLDRYRVALGVEVIFLQDAISHFSLRMIMVHVRVVNLYF